MPTDKNSPAQGAVVPNLEAGHKQIRELIKDFVIGHKLPQLRQLMIRAHNVHKSYEQLNTVNSVARRVHLTRNLQKRVREIAEDVELLKSLFVNMSAKFTAVEETIKNTLTDVEATATAEQLLEAARLDVVKPKRRMVQRKPRAKK